MVSAVGITLSGIQAAGKRLANSGENIASQFIAGQENGKPADAPFQPQELVQKSLAEGGVAAELRAIDPATVPVFEPNNALADENGIVQYPSVDQAQQVVDSIVAGYDFKANLRVYKTADDAMKNLLNIIS